MRKHKREEAEKIKRQAQDKIHSGLHGATYLGKDGNELKGFARFKARMSGRWHTCVPVILFVLVCILGVISFLFVSKAKDDFYNLTSLKSTKKDWSYSFSPQNIPSFFIAKKPVRAKEFQAFVRETGYVSGARKMQKAVLHNDTGNMRFEQVPDSFALASDSPAVLVTYLDALNFCNWKSEQEHCTPVYLIDQNGKVEINPASDGFRLPTAEEWEYAATKHKKLLSSGISEWSLSVYDESAPVGTIYRLIKGYNAYNRDVEKRASYVSYSNEAYPVDSIGFRLVKNRK